MPENNIADEGLILLAGMIAVLFLALLIVRLALFLNDFSRELRSINLEIQRTSGNERRYWLRKRRRLWLSLIPFARH